MSSLQINCSAYIVCSCPTLKLLWALPKYSYTAGPALVTRLLKGSQQQTAAGVQVRTKQPPGDPMAAPRSSDMKCQGKRGKGTSRAGMKAGRAHNHPGRQQLLCLQGAQAAREGHIEIHPSAETEMGKGKAALHS